MPAFPARPALPPLPDEGATGDDFNNPAIAFFQTLREEFAPWLDELGEGFADYVSSVLTATSATTLAIGTGSRAFTIGEGFAFVAGQRIKATSAANVANFMEGVVASYTGGVLTVTVDEVGGSGEHADWQLGLTIGGGSDLAVTSYTETVVDLGTGAAFSPDPANGTMFVAATDGNATITLPTALPGKSWSLEMTYGGAHTLAFAGETLKWAGGDPPAPTSTNGATDGYAFSCYVAGVWTGYDGGRDIG